MSASESPKSGCCVERMSTRSPLPKNEKSKGHLKQNVMWKVIYENIPESFLFDDNLPMTIGQAVE